MMLRCAKQCLFNSDSSCFKWLILLVLYIDFFLKTIMRIQFHEVESICEVLQSR